jgi:hypothetical protein
MPRLQKNSPYPVDWSATRFLIDKVYKSKERKREKETILD